MSVEQQFGWASRGTTYVPPVRRFDVSQEHLDGEAILVDPRDGNSHRLNQTSLAVWKWCDGASSTKQIAERLTEVYDVGFDDALDHVNQLVALFAELQLLDVPGGL